MLKWIREKTELQKLQLQYCKLMKRSYQTAIKDKQKSDFLHDQAHKILLEIQKIEQPQS